VPDYAGNVVAAQVLIDGAKQDVMYNAHLMVDGQLVGVVQGSGARNPFVIEMVIPRDKFDLRSLKEAKEVELVVRVGYNAAEMVTVIQKPKFGPAPAVGPLERLGDILSAVLNNFPVLMTIVLVLSVMAVFPSAVRWKEKQGMKSGNASGRSQREPEGNGATVVFPPAPAIRARTVQNGDRMQEIVTNIEAFPFLFGRDKLLEHGLVVEQESGMFLNLRNDRAISRTHFQLVRTGQTLGINVLSPNGVKVNERTLGKSETAHISSTEPTMVQIGEQTKIELTPIHLM
jgi:hypothetical protein